MSTLKLFEDVFVILAEVRRAAQNSELSPARRHTLKKGLDQLDHALEGLFGRFEASYGTFKQAGWDGFKMQLDKCHDELTYCLRESKVTADECVLHLRAARESLLTQISLPELEEENDARSDIGHDFTEEIIIYPKTNNAKLNTSHSMRALLDTATPTNAIHLRKAQSCDLSILEYKGARFSHSDGPEFHALGSVNLHFCVKTYQPYKTWRGQFVVLRDPPFDVLLGSEWIKFAGILQGPSQDEDEIAQRQSRMSGPNGLAQDDPGPQDQLLDSSQQNKTIFMHYTISEDRCGSEESTKSALLAALGAREAKQDSLRQLRRSSHEQFAALRR